jgi:hypothetical protein
MFFSATSINTLPIFKSGGLTGFAPILPYLDNYRFIVSLEVREYVLSTFSSLQRHFALSSSTKNPARIMMGAALDGV